MSEKYPTWILRLVRLISRKEAEHFYGQIVLHFADGKVKQININEAILDGAFDEKLKTA